MRDKKRRIMLLLKRDGYIPATSRIAAMTQNATTMIQKICTTQPGMATPNWFRATYTKATTAAIGDDQDGQFDDADATRGQPESEEASHGFSSP